MVSLRLFLIASVLFSAMAFAQEFEGEFDPSGGGQLPPGAGLDQYGVQPEFAPEGAEQYEGGAESFDGGFVGQPQGGPQQGYEGMQPNFAEESVQRVHRILPAMRQ